MIKKTLSIVIICLLLLTTLALPISSKSDSTKKNCIIPFFDSYVEILMRIGHIPSLSVGLIKNDELVFAKAYGYYDIENKKETTLDTIYPIGSITKVITATAMMQIIENESYNVNLDDDVNKYLPFKLRNPNFPDINITIKNLLTHTTSIMDNGGVCHMLFGDPNITTYPHPYLRELLLPNGSLYMPEIWSDEKPPGEMQYYTYSPWGLIEMIIENLTGQNINDYCKEHIFYPLKMYDTSYRLYDLDIDRVALEYEYLRNYYRRLVHYSWIPYGVGNVRSTISDLSHFLIAHMNGGVWKGVRILKESTVEQMQTIQYPDFGTFGLAFSFNNLDNLKKDEIIGHGGFPYNKMFYRPSDKTGVILFENVVAFPSNAVDFRIGADVSLMHLVNNYIAFITLTLIYNRLFFKGNFILK
jgi:CubicO group peptidase (beta-lactamase class C family)